MAKDVVYQGKFSAVVRREEPGFDSPSYDVWRWNLLKRKWVRMANHASGFAELGHARPVCDDIDQEATAAVDAARDGVPPLAKPAGIPMRNMRDFDKL